jgi:hydroxyacylglutathione hydrolase
MFFRQVLYQDLGCASYVLGDHGEAMVVDPRFDIEVYLRIAREQDLLITHVVDTHDHADHISGRARLAALTGAQPHRPARAQTVQDGDLHPGAQLSVGGLRVVALATPGHRPEHLALAVSDDSRSPDPWMVLSGDSLLVGDLARPDLAVTPEVGARDLHSSVHSLLTLGDHVELWPAHVGGSLCGGAGLSGKTSSTLGYERRNNRLLSLADPEFVQDVTASIPARPANLQRIVEANRRRTLEPPTLPPVLEHSDLLNGLAGEVTVLDAREPAAFDRGHIEGAINLPATASSLGTRAGWALRPHEPIIVAAGDLDGARAMTRALHAVGLWQIIGIALSWEDAPIERAPAWDVATLAGHLGEERVALVDVRDSLEWRAGHVHDSLHLPLARLGNGRDVAAPKLAATIAVACAGGVRAAFAASLLRRAGWSNVVRVAGGIGDLPAHGIALVGGGA